MLHKLFPHGLALSALVLLLLSHSNPVVAQGTGNAQETITLRPGGIFEIYADTLTPDPQVSWVFSKGQTFIQADRGTLFSIRPTEIAEYFLTGEVADQQGAPRRNIFAIQVRQDVPLIPQTSTSSADSIVRVFPAPRDDGVVTIRGTQIIQLDVIHPDVQQLALDVNIEKDQNNDGDPFNDDILQDSIFKLGRGSLYIWLTPTVQKQTLLLAAQLKNGAFSTQKIEIISQSHEEFLAQQAETEAQQRKERTRIVSAVVEEKEKTYKLSVHTEPGVITGPVFYHWDFGDGTQSLMDEPEHIFPEANEYHVRVHIRDAFTGEDVLQVDTPLSIAKSTEEGTLDDAKEDDPDEFKEESQEAVSYVVSTIIKAAIIFAIAIGAGLLGMFLFSKIKGKSLQKSLEDAEKKLISPDDESATDAPPMQLTDEEGVKEGEEGGEKEEEGGEKEGEEKKKEKTPAPETPEINRQVPSWLAPSPQADEEMSTTTQEEGALPPPPSPPAKESVQQDQMATSTPPPADAATPPWLEGKVTEPPVQETTETKAPETSPPAAENPPPAAESATPPWLAGAQQAAPDTATTPTTPLKSDPPAPAPTDEAPPPTKEPAPAPESPDASVPPWLQGTATQTSQTPASSPPQAESPPAPTSTPPATETPPASPQSPPPATDAPPASETNTPPWLQGTATSPSASGSQGTAQGAGDDGTSPPPAGKQGDDQTISKEERERERKRKKRQRYRENKRQRELEAKESGAQPPEQEAVKESGAQPPTARPTQPPEQEAAQTPDWLKQSPTTPPPSDQQTPPPTPAEQKEQAAPPPAPAEQKKPAIPPWLQGTDAQSTPPPSTPPATPPPVETPAEQTPPQQAGSDEDVKFVISADSLDQQNPPPPAPEVDEHHEEKPGE